MLVMLLVGFGKVSLWTNYLLTRDIVGKFDWL